MPHEKQFDVNEGLQRARDLFWSRGYEATSMQDLVEAMGINRASLYATYGDKRSLFLSALRHYDQTVRRDGLAELAENYPPRQAIAQIFERFAGMAQAGMPAKGCFVANSALELAPHDPEVREIVAQSQRGVEEFFQQMIVEGKRQGDIRPNIDPVLAASGLLASLLGLIVLSRSRPKKALLKRVIDGALGSLD